MSEQDPLFNQMPAEPEGLPGPDEIAEMELKVWIAHEDWSSAIMQGDRDLALEAHRVIFGNPEADIPKMVDRFMNWRTREELDRPLTPKQRADIQALNETIRRQLKRLPPEEDS